MFTPLGASDSEGDVPHSYALVYQIKLHSDALVAAFNVLGTEI